MSLQRPIPVNSKPHIYILDTWGPMQLAASEHRGKGIKVEDMQAAVEWCRKRNAEVCRKHYANKWRGNKK